MDWTSSASGSPRRKIPGRTSGHQLSEQTTGSSPLDPASSNVNATSASDASANDRKRQIIMSRKPKLVRRDLRTTQSSGALDVKHRQDFIANKTNEQLHNDQHDRFRKEQQTEQQSQVDLVKDWDWKLDTSKSTGSADNRAERNSEHDALRAGQESVHQEDYEPKPFLINYSEIEIGKVLGRGACATVYEGKWLHIPVAVKIFNDINGQHAGIERLASSDENDRKAKVGDYEKEFWLLLQIRHPNCLLYMGICFEPVVCIVTELFSGGSIANYLHGPKAQKFSPSKGLEMISGVARGMYYLHASTPPILHRDLKASNILINSMITHCVICDFGLSDQFFRDVSGKNSTDPGGGHGQGEMIGTVYTMAPEVMEGKEYTPASDVYSFGVLMYEIYTGRTPFPNLKPIQIMFQVCDGNRPKFFESDKVPPLLRDLIMRCWAHDPEDRPSFKAVVEALTDENLKSEVTIAQAAENELKKPDVGELSKRLLDVAFMGNDDELLKLINAGADINYSDYDKRTALHVAAAEGKVDCMRVLIRLRAKLRRDRWNNTPMVDAMNYAERTQDSEPMRLLREYEGRHSVTDNVDGTGLQVDPEQEKTLKKYSALVAASRGDVEEMRKLLNDGIDVNLCDYDRRTPLMVAASDGKAEIVELLLEYGANVRSRDRWGSTAYKEAERCGYHEIMMLIRRADDKAETQQFTISMR